jgi:hypothetical protein|tara:strand:- start:196 stop:618 length:423 start_codon:yes stop_codon:yes gene_type:complete
MVEKQRKAISKQDESNGIRRVRRVRFPVLSNLEIKCPICNGQNCNVCNQTGIYELDSEPYVEIQMPLIIKYIVDNIQSVSQEIQRLYGKTPNVETYIVTENYEVIRVDSLSGSVWIALNLKEVENPKYFYNKESVNKWLA